MKRSEYDPLIGPDDSLEPFIGGQYRMDMHYLHRSLPQLLRLPDISVRTGEGLLEPGKSCHSVAFVPKDYFPDHLLKIVRIPELRALMDHGTQDEFTAMYIRYLLESRLFSIKSKLAQSCLEHQALTRSAGYLNYPVDIQTDGFYFPLKIINLNPKLTYSMPKQPFPAFRFYIPGQKLVGQELLSQAKAMQLRGLVLEDLDAHYYRPHEFDEVAPTDPLLFKSSDNPISSLIVPIEREADFIQEKTVNIQDLIDCPSKDRQALDKIWGLQWYSPGSPSLPVYGEEVTISESGPLIMPDGVAGIIDHQYNWLNNFQFHRPPERGMMRHITSPLIDPKFGYPNGQPIRFEVHKRSVIKHDFNFVRMFLHPSN